LKRHLLAIEKSFYWEVEQEIENTSAVDEQKKEIN